MKSELRIVFMGTPEFAVATLGQLVDSGYQVVGVITAPDRPAGRGRKLRQSAVKQYALENGLTVLQPTNLKKEAFLKELKALNANLQIVVAFRMLPKSVWNMPVYGTFNLHASLLPDYRGAAPINWAIINGETKTGVTTFFIDDKIDTGEIILQQETFIDENETAGQLHDRLMILGAQLVLETVHNIMRRTVERQKQIIVGNIKSAPKINRATCEIDWHRPIDEIYNHIRGLCPYPAAWTTLTNASKKIILKIYWAAKEKVAHNHKIGLVLTSKTEMKIAVKDGYIVLLKIQLPGKKMMAVSDLLNGLKLQEKAQVG